MAESATETTKEKRAGSLTAAQRTQKIRPMSWEERDSRPRATRRREPDDHIAPLREVDPEQGPPLG